eukprot:gene14253-16821_t
MYTERSEFLTKSAVSLEVAPLDPNAGRMATMVASLKKKAIESRQEIDDSVDGQGVKGKLKQMLRYLEERVHPEEPILQQFAKIDEHNLLVHPTTKHSADHANATMKALDAAHHAHSHPVFTVLYPANIGQRRARKYASIFIRQRAHHHKLWAIINTAIIPLTFAATILPGPNVFLAYNLYRLYGHLVAIKGCANLRKLSSSKHCGLIFKSCPDLEAFDGQEEAAVASADQIDIEPTNDTNQLATTTTVATEFIPKISPNFALNSELIDRLSNKARIPGLSQHIKKIEGTEKKQLIHQ